MCYTNVSLFLINNNISLCKRLGERQSLQIKALIVKLNIIISVLKFRTCKVTISSSSPSGIDRIKYFIFLVTKSKSVIHWVKICIH